MTSLKLIIAFILTALYSCGQNNTPRKTNPEITRLSDKIIPLVNDLKNSDSCKQALLYLDSATAIDNSCFLCYFNKLMFLYPLKQYAKAIETMNECIRIKPWANELYMMGGILYEKVGDTISSKKYFLKSLAILTPVLDTMKNENISHEMLLNNKAINLIMLGHDKEGKNLLKTIAERQQDPASKQNILSLLNKNKKELVDMVTASQ